ncbi:MULTISPECIES: ATP-binding protein [unclassified Cryobacterium]|nr:MULTISPECIES: ATP-binding protein [unclassified Cryobacterium]MDY7528138.1 ATP-binding protein [Cryobacterium sp. 10C2]MDY7556113.1 ATP-binding protein [Cryobacterium sp. 10C3]MEB0292434.1 ATP-binding protein [Cryobacterium sp. 10C2]
MAANPCPCGQYGVAGLECSCPPSARRRYLARISGPLLDRIDIQLHVNRITAAQLRLAAEEPRLTTSAARERVIRARRAARERLAGTPWSLNSAVPGSWLRSRHLRLDRATTAALDRALERGGITMRGYDRVLRVAWSIADLEGADRPGVEQLGQALYLRTG